MDKDECKERFYRLVFPSHPNEWEVDEVMGPIAALGATGQELLFAQISAIWPVSHSLCLAFLEEGADLIYKVPDQLVPEWVRAILARYETGGLAGARETICMVDEQFLQPLNSRNRVVYEQISARMAFYIRGVSGLSLELSPSDVPSTDTRTLYMPHSLSLCPEYRQNVLIYKFLISLHWGFIRQNSFTTEPENSDLSAVQKRYLIGLKETAEPVMNRFFGMFPDPGLAADLFFLLETKRVMLWMNAELPGLVRQLRELRHFLVPAEPGSPDSEISRAMSRYGLISVCGDDREMESADEFALDGLSKELSPASTTALIALYDLFSRYQGKYRRPQFLDLLGIHDFHRAVAEIVKRREEVKGTFLMHLAQLLEGKTGSDGHDSSAGSSEESGQGLIVLSEALNENNIMEKALTIDNEKCEISDELLGLIREIEKDLGHVPDSYFSAAAGIAGRGVSRGHSAEFSADRGTMEGALLFDEWDHRRGGYRKDWCRLYEKDIPLVRSNFVAATLEKHKGLLTRIRRQFEMMLINEHCVGRQRDGDDFDLDAVVEARGDHRAGSAASDQLFIRLLRSDRDIVTLFLIDMSNSTEGWVGSVIKESLVLLCEAMEIIGDRYGIYGFSGMRRSRCEIFPIKDESEPFDASIPQRIGSVKPREYTRLGPAIRYASNRLLRCDARTRLLVTITDGKPEDYDDYKGEYAVEDTRKALMEARGTGLQTFCITVDRQPHDYLPHMYGAGNYVFVDDIEKLPSRMVDMYRMLTT